MVRTAQKVHWDALTSSIPLTGEVASAVVGRCRQPLWRELLRGSTILLGATGVASVLNVLYTFLAARLLTPTEYGQLVALFSVVSLLGTPVSTVQAVTARFAAVAAERDALGSFRRGILTLLRVLGFTAALLALGGLIATPWLAEFLHFERRAPVYWAIPLIAGAVLIPAFRGTLQGLCRFGTLAALSTADVCFKVFLGLGLIALGYGTAGALAALVVGTGAGIALNVAALGTFFRAAGEVHNLPGAPAQHNLLGAMARFSVPTLIANGGLSALVTLDTFLARHYLDGPRAGEYAAVAVAGRSLFWLSGAVATAILPLAARVDGRPTPSTKLLWPALLLTGGFALAGTLLFHLFDGPIMAVLFGTQYEQSSTVLPAYGWAAALLAMANVMVSYLVGRGQALVVVPIAGGVLTFVALAVAFHASAEQLVADLAVTAVVVCAGLAFVCREGKQT